MAHVTNPKPEPRAKLKARLARQHAILRRAARWQCFERDGGCCVVCGVPLHFNPQEPGADWYNTAHINEIKPRSLGGSDLDIENLNTKCPVCHVGKGFHDHA
jgi:5-methylcytosine-specific restriction endonuclease McrA